MIPNKFVPNLKPANKPRPVPPVVTPPTVPAFSEATLVAAVAANPKATTLTVSKDLWGPAKLMVNPGVHGKPVTSNPPASIVNLKVRMGSTLSKGTWSLS